MRYPIPSPHTDLSPLFEYDYSTYVVFRPLEEEVWAAIRLLATEDICVTLLRRRRSRKGRRPPLKNLASKIGSCITQADEYFWMALEASPRAAPLLHYYSMLNLTKALIYLEAPERLEDESGLLHGLSDPNRMKDPRSFSLDQESIVVYKGGVFPSLYNVLTGEEITRSMAVNVFDLLRHSGWLSHEVEDLGTMCRMVHGDFSIATDENGHFVRLIAKIEREDVRSHCGAVTAFEAEAPHFFKFFKRVSSDDPQQLHYESESLPWSTRGEFRAAHRKLRGEIRSLRLYRSSMNSGSRPSAEYLIPLNTHGRDPLPEPCVLLAITFYLGSLVRYQPHIYDRLLGSEEAWLLDAFIRQCPSVFSFIMLNHLGRLEHLFERL